MEKEIKLDLNSYLSFKLADEVFAANVSKVLNILEMVKISEVPQSPKYMKGVINLRGTVLPVVDTRIKFGMTPTEYTKDTCIVVMEIEMDKEMVKLGALVDSVQAVLEIDDAQIQPPPSIGNKYKSEFITGMAKVNEKFIMILDMVKVFTVDEIADVKDNTEKVKEKLKAEENRKDKKTNAKNKSK
ncbi:MAG: chemotaxis protein CheW [Bacteroidales bacterium]|jgi:purine-binding chemotaxis protein CheW|nr:chemotaxis protein CheW [Bacteroidales bacterium]